MLITFGNITKYKLPFLKTEEMANKICEYINTENSIITYMTIAYEQADTDCPFPHVHIAIKLDAKNAPACGAVKKNYINYLQIIMETLIYLQRIILVILKRPSILFAQVKRKRLTHSLTLWVKPI